MLSTVVTYIIPLFILIVIVVAIFEKLDVLSLFIDGVNNGLRVILKIFPSILAITVAINLLTETGAIRVLCVPINTFIERFKIPQAIIPLVILRPLSGSASMSMVLEIFKSFGPDAPEGLMASIIMASSETTFYVLAVLFGSIGIKKYRETLVAAIVADIAAVILAICWVKHFMI